ncbi:hypothetical protein [Gracilimonas halophila]|uniref:DUF5683 domain-containing protein n=1 Tax=Gracilimonas halophila TaxID=1834464 RepID=A0ABW5JKS4_9BACT
MRIQISLVLALLASISFSAYAQSISSFNNGIFKESQQAEGIDQPVHISDFKANSNSSLLTSSRENPGIAFAASALIPGAGQAANGKWVRAGVYFATEVVGLIYHLDRNAKAREQEKAYEQFTHNNWSVVAYAEWLVNYSQLHSLDNDWQSLEAEILGDDPNWENTREDWNQVPISTLRNVEDQTPFIFQDRIGSNFSHELPDYGSQQYYELISKYYQYQPGWRDWYTEITSAQNQNISMYRYFWNGEDEPFDLFYEGRNRAQEFNQNYRVAGNILKLLVVNHIVSAFDALFTVQLKKSRIETETNLMKLEQFSITWHF